MPSEPFSVELTDYIEPGQENQIAVLVLVKWHGQGALHQSMRLVACENLVDGEWSYTQGLIGEKSGIPEATDALQGWEGTELNDGFAKTGDHDIVWLRRSFDLDLPQGWVVPLAVRISGFEKKVNMYLNGHFLGRYRSEGPQEKFYIPEPWLREKNNTLVLMVDGWKPGIRLGEIGLESYPPKKQVEIEIKL